MKINFALAFVQANESMREIEKEERRKPDGRETWRQADVIDFDDKMV